LDERELKERRIFAEALRESADRYLSEQALRDALSRSYYSVFHLGCILLAKGYGNQKEFLKDLKAHLGPGDGLGKRVEDLQKLRTLADYRFDALRREYGGDVEKFREAAFEGLELGREVYSELLERIR
jgi:uncharacterized protein (UPF0332 family)